MSFTKAQLAAQNAELRLELTAALLTIERMQAERKPTHAAAPDTPEARLAAMQAAKAAAMAGKSTVRAF